MVCRGLVRSWFGSVVVVRVGPVVGEVGWFGGMSFGGAWKWSLVRQVGETSWFGIDVVGLVRHGGGEVRFGCDMGGRLDLDRYYRMDWESRMNSCTGNAG